MTGRRELLKNSALALLSAPLIATSASAAPEQIISTDQKLADYTEVFERAISKAAELGTGKVHVPAGLFPLRKIELRHGVAIAGAGRRATVLQALRTEEPGFITLASGPVQNSGLSGLTVQGGSATSPTNPGQWAMWLRSSPAVSGKPHGGLWWSIFSDVAFMNFDRGIWFESGATNHLLPHQFVSFRDAVIYGSAKSEGPAVKATGQVNQFSFSQIHIDRFANVAVEFSQSENKKTSPKLHHFDVTTIQNARQAVVIDGAHNIDFSNCWFERNQAGVLIRRETFGVSISNCRFANSASAGAAVNFEGNSTGAVRNNVFAGRDTKLSLVISPSADVEISRNSTIWGAED